MRVKLSMLPVFCGVYVLIGSSAQGQQTVGYTLVLSGNAQFGFNATNFTLTNDSTSASITGLTLTMGDTNYNFDYAAETAFTAGSGSFNLITPDTVDDGLRDNKIVYTFGGFAPTEALRFSGDIDRNGAGNTVEDARLILFNNGTAPNSTFKVSFSDGKDLTLTFPDGPTADLSYTFRQSAIVPAPNGCAVLGIGLSGLCWHCRKNRRK